jgi:hypothetical protein
MGFLRVLACLLLVACGSWACPSPEDVRSGRAELSDRCYTEHLRAENDLAREKFRRHIDELDLTGLDACRLLRTALDELKARANTCTDQELASLELFGTYQMMIATLRDLRSASSIEKACPRTVDEIRGVTVCR